MSDNQPNPQTQDPQSAYLDELRREASLLPESERAEHEAQIAELVGELSLADEVNRQADEAIRRAKSLAKASRSENKIDTDTNTFDLNLSRIGWIPEEDTVPIVLESIENESVEGGKYYFGEIYSRDRVTYDAYMELKKQGLSEELIERIKNQTIPNHLLSSLVKGGGSLRPINVTGNSKNHQRQLNTTYSAYKEYAGGTDNEAIFLVTKKDGVHVVLLAALFDHDDAQKIYRHTFLRTAKR